MNHLAVLLVFEVICAQEVTVGKDGAGVLPQEQSGVWQQGNSSMLCKWLLDEEVAVAMDEENLAMLCCCMDGLGALALKVTQWSRGTKDVVTNP